MKKATLATIGYEKSTPEDFFSTLQTRGITVLIDIRDRAQSRRRGFSKTALSLAAAEAGIEYIHLKALGDPKEGRDAARAGLMDKFRKIFLKVLDSDPAQDALLNVEELAKNGRVCLMCYEIDHHQCHRKLVSDHLERTLGISAVHLEVINDEPTMRENGRMLHPGESATA